MKKNKAQNPILPPRLKMRQGGQAAEARWRLQDQNRPKPMTVRRAAAIMRHRKMTNKRWRQILANRMSATPMELDPKEVETFEAKALLDGIEEWRNIK